MKLLCSVDIDVPLDKAVALYIDPEHFKDWQEGFKSYELLSGKPFTKGAKAKVVFVNGKQKIELIETIRVMNLPAEMEAFYEHEHMNNMLKSKFEALPGNKTRLTTEPGNIHFKSLLPRLLGWMMKGKVREQSQKWIDQFKIFAESEYKKA